MTVVRWDPFREVAQIQQQFGRVFGDLYGYPPRADESLLTGGSWVPAVDIYQNGTHEWVLKAELPDMKREEIELTIENATLTLKGEKKFDREVNDEQYHRVERQYGAFSRAFSLPQTVDSTKVSADYKNGVLTVKLPLRDQAKPRQIEVNVAA